MPIAGLVAGVLCASVGWMVFARGLRPAYAAHREQQASERALVSDCLANVDRVIDLPTWEPVELIPAVDLGEFEPWRPDPVIDLVAVTILRDVETVEPEPVIDLRDVDPRRARGLAWSMDDATVA